MFHFETFSNVNKQLRLNFISCMVKLIHHATMLLTNSKNTDLLYEGLKIRPIFPCFWSLTSGLSTNVISKVRGCQNNEKSLKDRRSPLVHHCAQNAELLPSSLVFYCAEHQWTSKATYFFVW